MEAHPYILARAFTVSRNKESKHIHTVLPGPSLITGTKNRSTSIHSCHGLHKSQEQRMEHSCQALTDSRNKEWKKHIHIFLPGPLPVFPLFFIPGNSECMDVLPYFVSRNSEGPGKNASKSIHSCHGLH